MNAGSARADAGFTLVEMMIVIVLITFISIIAMPSISSVFRLSLNSTTREMASLVRESYNSSVITKRVHRLAYDLEAKQFWVEVGPEGVLLESGSSRELEDRRGGSAVKTDPKSFGQEKSISRKKSDLPRGVVFEDIQTEQSAEPITTGLAYTHFFPHGFTEQTIIHLKDDSDHQLSLVISALGGKLRMLDGYVSKEDAFGK